MDERFIVATKPFHDGMATVIPGHTYIVPKKSQNGNKRPNAAAIIFFIPDMLATDTYTSNKGSNEMN